MPETNDTIIGSSTDDDRLEPHSADVDQSQFRARDDVDTDLETALVDATGHADSDVADLENFMDPGRSRFGSFGNGSPDAQSTTGI